MLRRRAFDFRTDRPVEAPLEPVSADTLVLVDGVFLQRRELAECWDARVFVRVSPDESLRRALGRDVALFGSQAAVRDRYVRRYLPAQQLYATRVRPAEIADVVVDNEDIEHPRLSFRWSR